MERSYWLITILPGIEMERYIASKYGYGTAQPQGGTVLVVRNQLHHVHRLRSYFPRREKWLLRHYDSADFSGILRVKTAA